MVSEHVSDINILFVDDEPLVLQSLSATFRKQYNVFQATSGQQAIEIIRQHSIHVVLCDQRMPGMLGHEVLRIIKGISPSTIRILLTGYADLDAIMNSVNSGEVFRYLTKPWKVAQLRQTVSAAVEIAKTVTTAYPSKREAFVKLGNNAQVTEPNEHDTPEVETANASDHKEKLLIVEFNHDQLATMTRIFDKNYHVLPCESVEEAFVQLSQHDVPVMVTDIDLNSEDGVEFLYAIKQEYPNTVIILLTQVRDALLAIKSINEFQVYRYHVKPCAVEELRKTIHSAMARARKYRIQPLKNIHYVARQVAPELIEEGATPKGNWLRDRLRTLRRKVFGV
ncbi:MAG: response regulator [Chlorobiales bacterium]|nr:response regulator [Chlorobiales bacterium]